MAIDREAIWKALEDRIKAHNTYNDSGTPEQYFVTIGSYRDDIPDSALQPACYVLAGQETKDPAQPGSGGKLVLHGFVVLYWPAEIDARALGNKLLQAVDAALEPSADERKKVTLGGLVEHCWIQGDTDIDHGIAGKQGAAVIPVHILVP